MGERYHAIICEGSAEQAIIEILLEHHCLIIENDDYLIDNGPIRIRGAKEFCDKYLGKNFGGKIDLYRIMDSRNENFNFGSRRYEKIFAEKINVVNVITPPEIEVLMIICENKYDHFANKGKSAKPSDYCKDVLGLKGVKSFDFVRSYFQDIHILLKAVKELHGKKKSSLPKDARTLYDLLKDEYK